MCFWNSLIILKPLRKRPAAVYVLVNSSSSPRTDWLALNNLWRWHVRNKIGLWSSWSSKSRNNTFNFCLFFLFLHIILTFYWAPNFSHGRILKITNLKSVKSITVNYNLIIQFFFLHMCVCIITELNYSELNFQIFFQ